MPWVSINNVGMDSPVMPTGMASETHMRLAQTTTASTAIPFSDKPSGRGKTHRIKANMIHAAKNPISTRFGLRPLSRGVRPSGYRCGTKTRRSWMQEQ